ncbi:hypothetical protein ACO2Q1_12605 [Brevundimonas sp. VNH65]|uniref:hypothetical protein n=1 Tax=Brevundimonas sp. VNH65 TaxID=3400917 RepID=UPI003BFDED80
MKTPSLIALAAVAGALFAAPAVAQTGDALIEMLFDHMDREFNDKGWRMTAVAEFKNPIPDGSSRGDIVRLEAGKVYVVAGVCDEDCSDFDIEVRNTDGVVVGSDVLDDDAPMVVLDNPRAGAYQVQGIMAGCSADPCLTGVRVYRKD